MFTEWAKIGWRKDAKEFEIPQVKAKRDDLELGLGGSPKEHETSSEEVEEGGVGSAFGHSQEDVFCETEGEVAALTVVAEGAISLDDISGVEPLKTAEGVDPKLGVHDVQ